MPGTNTGLFVAEGSSDAPLASLVETLFRDQGVKVRLTAPDFGQLPEVRKDVESRIRAGVKLMDGRVDLVVVHRDADNAGSDARRQEVEAAMARVEIAAQCCPVIPVRMTEAWVLIDEGSIRKVAGNPRGRSDLGLPKLTEIERVADPKELLRKSLLTASALTGRRREREAKRFNSQRRQLLELVDRNGPITSLPGWQRLTDDVGRVAAQLM